MGSSYYIYSHVRFFDLTLGPSPEEGEAWYWLNDGYLALTNQEQKHDYPKTFVPTRFPFQSISKPITIIVYSFEEIYFPIRYLL
jgi:hypothetical protein